MNKWPIHMRTTNGPWKKTHPWNVELISTQTSEKDSDPDSSIPKQAKAEYGKLQWRTDLGLDGLSKVS
jgi:hypothetical protein